LPSEAISIYKYFYTKVKRKVTFLSITEMSLWIMGRRPTTPEGSISVSARLPPSLQIGVQQLILDRWRKTGQRTSQNQLLVEALSKYLQNCGVDVSQIEHEVGNWTPKEKNVVTKFRKKPKGA
jgi:hypothetical protein